MALHYIRSGASGSNNGSSWANAWTSFASVTWTRGDTYYLAGGTYNEDVTITKPVSGSSWIYVKKANANDNGGDAGYSSSFSSDVAVINGYLYLKDGYISFDGVTGSEKSGHGIRVSHDTSFIISFEVSKQLFYIGHVEMLGPGYDSSATIVDGFLQPSTLSVKGLHIAYCWIHEVTRNGVTFANQNGTSFSDYGLLFENNVISETGGAYLINPGIHGQAMQIGYGGEDSYYIIRNNLFSNCIGTAFIAFLGTGNHHDHLIYNNKFVSSDALFEVSPGVVYGHTLSVDCSNIRFLNNSIYGVKKAQFFVDFADATGNEVKNNIFENCVFTTGHAKASEDSNGYFGNTGTVPSGTTNQIDGGSSTFIDGASGNFEICNDGYAIGVGVDLSATFTTDYNGATRTRWDLGAIKARQPLAPSSLTATAAGSTEIDLSWTDASSDETGFTIERSLNGSTGWTEIADLAAGSTSYTDTGLSNGTTYYYRVAAYNSYGSSAYSDTANATTTAAPVLLAGEIAPSSFVSFF